MDAWEVLKKEEVESFCKGYLEFLRENKTEREVVRYIERVAKENGFKNIEEVDKLNPGDRVYYKLRDKSIILAKVGEKVSNGIKLIGAHADSPRVDLRIMPIEDKKELNLGVFKISFYGGFATYVWLNVPLELRGIVFKEGKEIEVREKHFIIPDHLPHLSKKRLEERKAKEVVKGEEMKVLAVNTKEKGDEPFKEKILKILKEKYGIEEKDFIKAELELVPAYDPIEIGLDKSMIAGYGQDDRVCVYTSFKALLDSKNTKDTQVLWIVDREEIGSETAASARSELIKYFLSLLLEKTEGYSEIKLRRCLLNSKAISADVTAAIAPGFEDCYDFKNAAKLGGGIAIEKYGSAAGRYFENEASAEFVSKFVELLDKKKVPWQPAMIVSKAEKELGGGGTIAVYLARIGMDVLDAGVPLLAMHTPMEVASKADVYSAYLAYKVFFEDFTL